MSDDDFTATLKRVAKLKTELTRYEKILEPLKTELEARKLDVVNHMRATKNKRTEAVDGFYVLRSERKGFIIKDEHLVSKWLLANDFNLEEYIHLDKAMVKATAEAVLVTNGEILPGVEETVTEYLTIKEAKK